MLIFPLARIFSSSGNKTEKRRNEECTFSYLMEIRIGVKGKKVSAWDAYLSRPAQSKVGIPSNSEVLLQEKGDHLVYLHTFVRIDMYALYVVFFWRLVISCALLPVSIKYLPFSSSYSREARSKKNRGKRDRQKIFLRRGKMGKAVEQTISPMCT